MYPAALPIASPSNGQVSGSLKVPDTRNLVASILYEVLAPALTAAALIFATIISLIAITAIIICLEFAALAAAFPGTALPDNASRAQPVEFLPRNWDGANEILARPRSTLDIQRRRLQRI